jgi:prepilin-type N-terminal cleavage/methylation domain-containing protein
MQTKRSQKNKGFTLLETLIAIAILTVALGGAFGIAQKSLMTSNLSRTQTAAFFLAAEGLEMVRDLRDNIALYNNAHASAPIDWLLPIKNACGGSYSGCSFDIDPGSQGLSISSGGSIVDTTAIKSNCGAGCQLKVVGSAPSYMTSNSAAGTNSNFSRKIEITEVNPAGPHKEAVAKVTITWGSQSFVLTETFSNWHQLQ